MLDKSPRKKDANFDIKLISVDGSSHSLERKKHLKYLGVLLDGSIFW